jgi:N-acetylglucosaminyldiphosphoundecaprenol N-acetyl-beta-D-mannosaminyltransferase
MMQMVQEENVTGTVDVLGIPLHNGDISSAVNIVLEVCKGIERKNLCISATGAHGLVHAKSNALFRQVLQGFFLNLPDGMPAVWIGRLKGASKIRRCYGPDFFKDLLTKTGSLEINHFFCGGNPGVAEELLVNVKVRFQNCHVTGALCPPYLDVDQYNYSSISQRISEANADIVWIGLSTPKQEAFAKRLSKLTHVKFIICVGAAFDFHTDRVQQAPRWMQRTGLEWFFRVLKEPRRLYRRYLNIVPLFLFHGFVELFNFAAKKMK